ncbi:hypothetical protein HNQ62_002119 [Sulfurisphaera ohwakuensis]|uniref:Uncharacterized protein n=1 Tax=Sulfurisphaera ohwakuensis TaxID=69656 RepID=A0A7J9RUB4_SULOH|nr:hypothetical protein [Sulfurisphaera ohwakuensis]
MGIEHANKKASEISKENRAVFSWIFRWIVGYK